ncbi:MULTISPECIES: MipA/OmpV family protein [Vibrio]|uniref:MipA/OmpV family protein n=1 Tax=Vibrio lentus TaxID=136468 RepID=A0A1B9Q9L1_9VIBR|nr:MULTISPECIES: MipA/OmpV family protein [Vibrio]OCH56572.1 hypothetical protein A6E08_03475 [Vibrio lentus]PME50865.1 hypothetical protein BCV34_01130 [Vibrio lentus]PME58901.1 hypothetical protein BCV30_15425 [Vibrio lentus]PME80844.1 hypothetical protein BCV27_14995 [Vibrio lentus]PMG64970.1 hypothetical protein BCU86_16625 [Vibrio lentus]
MKSHWLKVLTIVTTTLGTTAAHAQISQWSLGVAASYSPAVYKDTPSNRAVIPMIGYEGEYFFMRGFSAGYRLLPAGSPQNVVLRAVYDPRTLKPSDSGNVDIQNLDERKASVLGGISYQLITLVGMFEATAGSDIGFQHNGLYAEAAWRLPIRRNGWAITPSIGYAYNGERLNNHLYGVSSAEAARTNLNEFEAGWDGQYFISLGGYLHVTPSIRLTGGVRYTNLEGDIENSPILESGINMAANVGVAYVF